MPQLHKHFNVRRNSDTPLIKMTKERKRLLIPIIIVGLLLIYCWITILTTEVLATWRHYVGLVLFIGLGLLFLKSVTKATIAAGIYLLLATFNALALTSEINTSWFGIGPIETTPVQLLSLGLFVLYFVLNMDSLINIYLDYKEAKQVKTHNRN